MKSAHIHGRILIDGSARFTRDIPKISGMLYGGICFADKVGYLRGIDTSSVPPDVPVITHRDIPGRNRMGVIFRDMPILVEDEVWFVGQPVAVVVADTPSKAREYAGMISLDIDPVPAVVDVEEALEKGWMIGKEFLVERGDVEKGFSSVDYVLEGVFASPHQEHFYLEPQVARACPMEEGQMFIWCTTQHPTTVQETVAEVLGVETKDITVEVLRLGGAFGGKEEWPTLWASLASVCARVVGRPVEISLTREEDTGFTGKRHQYVNRWKVGFDKQGRIEAYDVVLQSNGGAYADLSTAVMERSVLNAEGCYNIPNARVRGRIARTHLPPNTAFRGFGTPQAVLMIEYVMDRIAHFLKMDRLKLRLQNFYTDGDATPYGQVLQDVKIRDVIKQLGGLEQWERIKQRVDEFNRANRWRKQGVGIAPIKYGIAFTAKFLNQGFALVHIYTDGSISITTAGVEMGQGVATKMAQIAHSMLGVPLERIRVEPSNTKRIANASPTAASTAVDLNGYALRDAISQIKGRLCDFLCEKWGCSADELEWRDGRVQYKEQALDFGELVMSAYLDRINLSAYGHWRTPGIDLDPETLRGHPFRYFVYGAGIVVVEVDLLTGAVQLKEAYIVHDAGKSFSEIVDMGQIRGAFIQGCGWLLWEEVFYDKSGKNLACNASTYKIPTIAEVPSVFKAEFLKGSTSDFGVMASKGVGEPPFLYGIAGFLGVLDALSSAFDHKIFPPLMPPATPERILMALKEMEVQDVQ